ncbi:GNAT family N-acetyltransferase [Alkalibacillus haloalkaliphilus]|uniref:Aminoglycoside N(6')-acetyltransferase n=1 Tax=Alkalibacillus haloalkaliphilus TaxID=94136 RepID=A0A511W376_9BACI|nr:GNAT family protein [Alkalibacillus haloalkaliphilus]GEN45529.1 aminoglycoside N(6')-acetyltransferase [Alkalibacillus haloalkaliphilus]
MKIYLRELQKEDMVSVHQSTLDADIRYLTGTTRHFTLEQLYNHFERIKDDDTRYDFAICLSADEQIIGDLAILDIEKVHQKAGFRIALHKPEYFGKGFGTQAVKLALQYAFETLKLNRLQLEVYSHNPRAIQTYEKVGFTQEGILRQAIYYDGEYYDEIVMGMLKEEYDLLK